jgi:hypothetical protein
MKSSNLLVACFIMGTPGIKDGIGFQHGNCWGPSSSEGPQKHDLTMFSEL